MSNVPVNPADVLGDDHPAVVTAVVALSAFGGDLTRPQAARLLSMWQHDRELTDRERAAVLAQFPEAVVHSFIPSRIAGTMDDWFWTCACGEQIIQLEGETAPERLIAHVREAGR